MKIYIARHGVTALNKKNFINGNLDDPLILEGENQAREATLLLPNNIKHIYSSPLLRARQTAEIFNEKLGVDLTFHDELKEVNFGELNGTPFLDEYKARHIEQNYDWRPWGGESVEDVKNRVLRILGHIKSEIKDEEGLIVAHGGIIRIMHILESGKPIGEIKNASFHSFDLDKILKR